MKNSEYLKKIEKASKEIQARLEGNSDLEDENIIGMVLRNAMRLMADLATEIKDIESSFM